MLEMTITIKDATYDESLAAWMDGGEPRETGQGCADLQEAWLVNETHTHIRGWRYVGNGTWTGEARGTIVDELLALHTEAIDYVVEHLDEIRAEAA